VLINLAVYNWLINLYTVWHVAIE